MTGFETYGAMFALALIWFYFGFLTKSVYYMCMENSKKRKASEIEELTSLITQRLRADEGRDEPHSEG